jgi:hypothetical protein
VSTRRSCSFVVPLPLITIIVILTSSQVRAGSRLCRPALEGDGSSGASFFAGALSRQASEHSMSLKSYMEM